MSRKVPKGFAQLLRAYLKTKHHRYEKGVKIYTQVANYLNADGLQRRPGFGDRAFCIDSTQHLKTATAAQANKTAVSKKKPIVQVQAPRLDTPPAQAQPVDPASNDFLSTSAWRRLRMQALAQHGNRCQCCGASPDDGTTVLNVDHIRPRKLFPELALELTNLQILCEACNHGKGNWDHTDWRPNFQSAIDHIAAALSAFLTLDKKNTHAESIAIIVGVLDDICQKQQLIETPPIGPQLSGESLSPLRGDPSQFPGQLLRFAQSAHQVG